MAQKSCENCGKPIDIDRVVSVRVAHPEDGAKKTYYCSSECASEATAPYKGDAGRANQAKVDVAEKLRTLEQDGISTPEEAGDLLEVVAERQGVDEEGTPEVPETEGKEPRERKKK